MKTMRTRLVVADHHQLGLSAHIYLKYDKVRDAWALLAPEHVYWPDDISVAILNKLDGKRKVSEIVALLAKDYDAPTEAVGPDVLEFLQQWADERVIKCEAS